MRPRVNSGGSPSRAGGAFGIFTSHFQPTTDNLTSTGLDVFAGLAEDPTPRAALAKEAINATIQRI